MVEIMSYSTWLIKICSQYDDSRDLKGITFILFRGARHPLRPENPLKTKDFTDSEIYFLPETYIIIMLKN